MNALTALAIAALLPVATASSGTGSAPRPVQNLEEEGEEGLTVGAIAGINGVFAPHADAASHPPNPRSAKM